MRKTRIFTSSMCILHPRQVGATSRVTNSVAILQVIRVYIYMCVYTFVEPVTWRPKRVLDSHCGDPVCTVATYRVATLQPMLKTLEMIISFIYSYSMAGRHFVFVYDFNIMATQVAPTLSIYILVTNLGSDLER